MGVGGEVAVSWPERNVVLPQNLPSVWLFILTRISLVGWPQSNTGEATGKTEQESRNGPETQSLGGPVPRTEERPEVGLII